MSTLMEKNVVYHVHDVAVLDNKGEAINILHFIDSEEAQAFCHMQGDFVCVNYRGEVYYKNGINVWDLSVY